MAEKWGERISSTFIAVNVSVLNGLMSIFPDIRVSEWTFVGITFVWSQEARGRGLFIWVPIEL
jgi:hypothetical protein